MTNQYGNMQEVHEDCNNKRGKLEINIQYFVVIVSNLLLLLKYPEIL